MASPMNKPSNTKPATTNKAQTEAQQAIEHAEQATRPPAARRAWRTIERQAAFAERWQPTEAGAVLEGIFNGLKKCRGQDGDFYIGEVTDPNDKLFSVSGYQIITALRCVEKGSAVQITYRGIKQLPKGRTMKEYEIQTDSPEIDPVCDDDIQY